MIHLTIPNDFAAWRAAARKLLAAGVPPGEICWGAAQNAAQNGDQNSGQSSLFPSDPLPENTVRDLHVPREFVGIAKVAACFDSDDKWDALYRVLYRLINENRKLLKIESDADVRKIFLMKKAVARDIHKFHAFVRFRRAEGAEFGECGGQEIYVAWHEPHHFTVERATPFFARRFGSMRWSILTPKGCAHWDLEKLTFSPAARKDMAPGGDDREELWLSYYRSIFNPFRLNAKMMKKEMPVRHWKTLPEAQLIPELIRGAKERAS